MAKDGFETSKMIDASAMQVLSAFLDPQALKIWWKARNAVVQPRPGGLFVLEWEPGSMGQDDLLGPLGGTLVGVLDKSMAGHFVHFGSLHSVSPRGEIFGPTRLEVNVYSKGDPRRKPTLVSIKCDGYQEGERWARYLQVTQRLWETALARLVYYCETQGPSSESEAENRVEPLGDAFLAEAVLRDRRIS